MRPPAVSLSQKTCSQTWPKGAREPCGRKPLLGSLEVGKKADLIVLDTQRAHLVPAGRILSAWINNGQPSDVESVLVDGRFIMRDRKILTMDEASLIAEADKVGRRIWSEVEAASPVTVPRLPGS